MEFPNLGYFRTDIQNNFLPMENSTLDATIAKLPLLSTEERISKYKNIQKEILQQATVKPLFFVTTLVILVFARQKSTEPSVRISIFKIDRN